MSKEFTIGRDNAGVADILLPGSHISALHAKMGVDSNGRLWIKDIGSTNGTTLINAGVIREIGGEYIYVNSGEVVAFGGIKYTVEQLFRLLPIVTPSREPEGTQSWVRCKHCGSATPPARTCIKCGR